MLLLEASTNDGNTASKTSAIGLARGTGRTHAIAHAEMLAAPRRPGHAQDCVTGTLSRDAMGHRDEAILGLAVVQRLACVEPASVGPWMVSASDQVRDAQLQLRPSECKSESEGRYREGDCRSN